MLTVGPWTDCTLTPMPRTGETVYASTVHGTVVVSLGPADSVLRVGFVATPQQVHYRDTLRYSQVVYEPAKKESAAVKAWRGIGLTLLGCVAGIVALLIIALKTKVVE